MDAILKNLFEQVADLHEVPQGAYNFRVNGEGAGRNTTENINIVTKSDKPGIDIIIKAGTKHESVHIPVVISQSGLQECVYNDFYVGEDADVTIVAGCGIHTFHIGKNARVKYVEKHYGTGEGTGERILNPETVVFLDEGSSLEMDTVQIEGVDSTVRTTRATVGDRANLVIREKIMTHDQQYAKTDFSVEMNGEDSSVDLVSRSVAKGNSRQEFFSNINGNNRCKGHSECDAILMENGSVAAAPMLTANHLDASLIHEAAIGKIAGDQIIKLMTLGLTEEEAEKQIITGFLK